MINPEKQEQINKVWRPNHKKDPKAGMNRLLILWQKAWKKEKMPVRHEARNAVIKITLHWSALKSSTVREPRYRVNQVMSDSNTSSNTNYILSVNFKRVEENNNRTIFTRMILNQEQVKFQVDCSAAINIILLKYVLNTKLQPALKKLQMWNETKLLPLRKC